MTTRDVCRYAVGGVGGTGAIEFDHSRGADGERTSGNIGVVEHDRIRADNSSGVHNDAVQHNAGVADQTTGLDRAAFEVHHVPDNAIVTDDGGVLLGRVQHAVVLHAGARADDDRTLVAA